MTGIKVLRWHFTANKTAHLNLLLHILLLNVL